MGVSLYATNSKYSFEMGYGGFYNLRKNIAYAVDVELGDIYERMLECHSRKDYDWYCSLVNKMVEEKRLDGSVIDFLFQSDAGGAVEYKVCKKVYDVIKDIDFGDKGFQYVSYRDNDYEKLKLFLLECYRYHRKMRWS